MTPAFFYDLGSPYAWLAAERVDAHFAPEPVEWVPVLLSAIFRATGRSSWARTDARADGIAEIERRALNRGLPPPAWPAKWPDDGLQAMRAAVHAHALGAGRRFARAAFAVHFTDGLALSAPAHIALAAERAGLEPHGLLAATGEEAVKDVLTANTSRALGLGVSGVPSVAVGGEVFWGDDALQAAAEHRLRDLRRVRRRP